MALLLASNGIHVSLNDPSEDSMARVIANARHDNLDPSLLSTHTDHASLCASLDEKPRIILFSLPHGTTGDTVLEELKPHLERDDLIIDASNEHWANTERRQAKLVSMGVYYIGCGVSGGYQAARRGPSMCPGGEDRALDLAMPLFEIMAAKDRRGGRPCTGRCGMGGSGHYVKMVHNGIEHGMMSAQAEAWQIMEKGLGMSFDEIAEVFRRWNEEGELVCHAIEKEESGNPRRTLMLLQKDTFLIEIGAEICRQRNEKGKHVLSDVEDKVVQDIDGSEGTGVSEGQFSSNTTILLNIRTGLDVRRGHPSTHPSTHPLRRSLRPPRIRIPPGPTRDQYGLWWLFVRESHRLVFRLRQYRRREAPTDRRPPQSRLLRLPMLVRPGHQHNRSREPGEEMADRFRGRGTDLARRLHHPLRPDQ